MHSLSTAFAALFFASVPTQADVVTDRGAARALLQSVQHQQAAAPVIYKAGAIVIESPWLRGTPQGAKVAGGYMRISNTGSESDRLIGGSLHQARRFELHEMTMTNNVMQMRPLANGIEIKPGQTVELKPGGLHAMGLDLEQGYAEGTRISGTLVFEKAGAVTIEYTVGPIGGGAPARSHH